MSLFSRLFLINSLTILATLGVVFFVVRKKAASYFMGLADKYGIEPAELHEMFLQALNYGFLIAGVFSIAIACLLIWWLVRKFVRPIEDLSRQFNEISSGGYQVRAAPQSSPELARLASSFNSMANELENQEKLRRRLVTDVAHELKTPLMNLRGTLEGIDDGLIKADRRSVFSLTQEVDRLTSLINDILDLARLEANQEPTSMTSLDLNEVLLKSLKSFDPIFTQKRLQLSLNNWPKSIAIAGDRDKLLRVFENLLSNVTRFAPYGDQIDCEYHNHQQTCMVKISNSASYLDERDIDNLFERFYRSDLSRSSEGSGLGLSIVKEIIELHGGNVGAEYRDNRFGIWFQIPSCEAA